MVRVGVYAKGKPLFTPPTVLEMTWNRKSRKRGRWEVLGMPPRKPRDYWQLILWEVLRRDGAEKTRIKIASIAERKRLTLPLHSQHCILNWSSFGD
jgi:hypothetical protein